MSRSRTAQLDIELSNHEIERLEALLGEYRTLNARIALQERWARGDGLLIEPSVTVSPPREDDVEVLHEIATQSLSDGQEAIVTMARRLIDGKSIGKALKARKEVTESRYATKLRLSLVIGDVQCPNHEDQELLDQFVTMLRESCGELWVHLTQNERLAILREIPIQRARQKLETLRMHKAAMDPAMEYLQEWYPEYYEILWKRYVENRLLKEVCDELHISEDTGTRRTKVALCELRQQLQGMFG